MHQTTVTDRNNSMMTIEDGLNNKADGNIAEVISQISHSFTKTDDNSHQNLGLSKHIGLENEISRL